MHEPLKPKTMNKRLLFIALFSLCINQSKAWDLIQPTGGRSSSLGRCSVALNDFWSCNNNPAGIASYKFLSAGIYYENRFMIKELGYKSAGLIFPIKQGALGVGINQFGYNLYNENVIGIIYARSFGKYLCLGLKLDYIFIKYNNDNYLNINTVTFEFGAQSYITENICLAWYILNPTHVKIRSPNIAKFPIIMRLGISYKATDDFMITSEIEENFRDNISFRFGLEYGIIKNVHLRCGFQLNSNIITFGIGFNFKTFNIDISSEINQALGTSLQCSLTFNIRNKNNKGGNDEE